MPDTKKKKSIAMWIVVALLLIAMLFVLYWATTRDQSAGTVGDVSFSISTVDHVKGNMDASLLLVEYSDFQCPACASYSAMVAKLSEQYPNQIAIVYRHFPLSQIHRNAEAAAIAAEAAGLQGAFWQMHDMLFEQQSIWSKLPTPEAAQAFADYAKAIGIDPIQFDHDLDLNSIANKIVGDFDSGLEAGVFGTPSFFLNNQLIKNPRTYEAFSSLIRSSL